MYLSFIQTIMNAHYIYNHSIIHLAHNLKMFDIQELYHVSKSLEHKMNENWHSCHFSDCANT